MGRPPSLDWTNIEHDYVSSDISLRELARRYSCGWSTISLRSKRDKWVDKRQEYKDRVARRSYEKTIDKVADEQADIRHESVLVMRATLRRYAEQLRTGAVAVTTKDAVSAVQTLLLLMGEPTARSENRIVEFSTGGIAPEDLHRLVELARSRLVEGSVVESPQPQLEGTREG
jgi:response regulator RpfG family c-di-GMP phosphodiesterase